MNERPRTGLFFFATALCILAAYLHLSPISVGNTLVLTDGKIVTMADGEAPADVEALLVINGRIAGLGSRGEMIQRGGDDAQIVLLEGATLMPGWIEPHTHPIASALLGTAIDVSGFNFSSRGQVMAALREGARGFQPTPWTIAFGWDPMIISDLTPPSLQELDAIAPDRPLVIVAQMLHDAYVNTAALEAAGIDRQTPDPANGEFVRDAEGELTGHLREVGAIDAIIAAMPAPEHGAIRLVLNLEYGAYARAGYTTVAAMGSVGRSERPLELFEELAANPDVPVRLVAYAAPERLTEQSAPQVTPNRRYSLRGVKFWMDGSPFTGGAAFREPYEENRLTTERLQLEPGWLAPLMHEEAAFEEQFGDFHRRGFQISVHTQGERAVDRVLDVAERVLSKTPRPDHRHRLEHDALITRDQLARAAKLGFTTSFFIDHVYYYGQRIPELLGSERAARYMPVAWAADLGLRPSLHSDNPATPINALRVLKTATTRQPRDLRLAPVAPTQALTVEQALRAITIDAAWQLGIEDQVGSIEIGKAADFVLLSKNPLDTKPEKLDQIRILGTWIDGHPVDARKTTRANLVLAVRAALEWAF